MHLYATVLSLVVHSRTDSSCCWKQFESTVNWTARGSGESNLLVRTLLKSVNDISSRTSVGFVEVGCCCCSMQLEFGQNGSFSVPQLPKVENFS